MGEEIVKFTAEQLKGVRQPRFTTCSQGHHEFCVGAHDMFVCGCDCHRGDITCAGGTTDEGDYEIGGEA